MNYDDDKKNTKKKKIGWIIREKIINIPEEITFPLFSCIRDDLLWAKDNEGIEYSDYVIFSPCYSQDEYAQSEDYLFANISKNNKLFTIPKPPPALGVDEPESYALSPWTCKVLVLKQDEFFNVINSLENI